MSLNAIHVAHIFPPLSFKKQLPSRLRTKQASQTLKAQTGKKKLHMTLGGDAAQLAELLPIEPKVGSSKEYSDRQFLCSKK
jgi:hypothetical protein